MDDYILIALAGLLPAVWLSVWSLRSMARSEAAMRADLDPRFGG